MVPLMATKDKGPKGSDGRPVAQNRKARHDYEILETFEAGMVLVGSEVKSLREGRSQLREAFARVEGNEVWLYGAHIPPYSFANGRDGHAPDRRRKLLLHHREINQLLVRSQVEHLTIVPLAVYFKDGRAKIEIALARGRKSYDKRQVIAERDAAREDERGAHRRGRSGDRAR